MSSPLDRIEEDAKFRVAKGRDVLALVNVAKAAEEAANPMTPDGPAAPFMWLPANEALREALAALGKEPA